MAHKQFKQLSFPGTLEALIDESLEVIASVSDHAPLTVAFSGGKDSIVLAELVRLSGIEHTLLYHDTTIEPPDVRQFVKRYYPQVKITRPERHYWSYFMDFWPPSRLYRWCCNYLKHGQDKSSLVLTGVRREESIKRRKYHHIDKIGKKLNIQPILNWPEWAIWQFIEDQGLAWPEIYNHVDRVGCVICPLRSYSIHKIWRNRYPNYYKTFEKHFKRWLFEKKQYDPKTYPADLAIEMWYRHNGIVRYDELRETA